MAGKMLISASHDKQRSRIRLGTLAASIAILIASVAIWVALTAKLHLHVPIAGKNGKPEYYSIITHQNCVDLFSSAQEHDKEGKPDLANIDYKTALEHPSFQQLAAKYKSTMIELVDSRTGVSQPDYFDELITHSRIGYWSQSQMPLRVYVPDESKDDGFGSFDRKEIDRCFKQWCKIIPDRLSFKYVDDPDKADIVFTQTAHAIDLSYSQFVLAHTIPMPAGPEKWGVFPASKATIHPLRSTPEIIDYQDARALQRHIVFLHEIGHSLGIIGHSCNASDLMYFSGSSTSELSARDIATIKRIYAPGNIYDRAEKNYARWQRRRTNMR